MTMQISREAMDALIVLARSFDACESSRHEMMLNEVLDRCTITDDPPAAASAEGVPI